MKFKDNEVEVSIEFRAVLAKDFSNDLKTGDKIELNGKKGLV